VDVLENIIKGCKKGNNADRERLYKMFSSVLYGLCLRYAKNVDDAKDIMQEGFIKIFQKIDQYRGAGSFEGWMKRIMINSALEKYRNMYYLNEYDDSLNHKDTLMDENQADKLNEKELLILISQLPSKYRMVFNMYAIEGYSHKEISETLKISEGTSKSNLSRARAILQKKIIQLSNIEIKSVTV
jgi:RNA polymerase sigma factor (sigma-70 family)